MNNLYHKNHTLTLNKNHTLTPVRAYSSCSNHGICTLQKNPKKINSTCFFCFCNSTIWTDDFGNPVEGYSSPVKWAGNACQYQDISTSFHIVFWVSFALIALLLMVIGAMTSMEQGDSFTVNQFEHRSKED